MYGQTVPAGQTRMYAMFRVYDIRTTGYERNLSDPHTD